MVQSINIPLDEFKEFQKEWIKEVLTEQNQTPKKGEPELLTRSQTARILGISLPTLNEYTKTGKVAGYRIGSRVRYKKDEVFQALQEVRKYRRGQ